MKRMLLVLFVLLAPAAASPSADAQIAVNTWEFSGSGGLTLPFHTFGRIVDTGFNIGGAVGVYVDPALALGAGCIWNNMDVPDDTVIDGNALTDLTFWELTVWGKYLIRARNPVSPYVSGGFGLVRATQHVEIPNVGGARESDNNFGATAGLGVQMQMSGRFGLFAEGRGAVEFSAVDDATYITIRAGVLVYPDGSTLN